MSHRFVRLLGSGIVIAGAVFLSSPKTASASAFRACGQVYCHTGPDCPSDQYLLGFCAGKECPGLPGCAEDFGTTCDNRATIVCNANES